MWQFEVQLLHIQSATKLFRCATSYASGEVLITRRVALLLPIKFMQMLACSIGMSLWTRGVAKSSRQIGIHYTWET